MANLEKEKLIELVTKAQAGDEDAYSELYSIYHDDMYRIAIKNTMALGKTHIDDAEDVLQEAMMKAHSSISSLSDPLKFPEWLSRIVSNKAADYMTSAYKKHTTDYSSLSTDDEDGKEIEYDPEDESIGFRPDLKLDEETKQDIVRDVLDSLNEEQKTVTILCYYDELTIKEASEKLGVPMSTVVGRLQMAKKSIKQSVTNIEKKQGIKLHSIAPLPFFLLCLGKASEETGKVAATTAAITAGAATTTAAGSTEAAVATGAATKTGVAAGTTVATKVGIGAAVVATAVAVPIAIKANQPVTVDMFENLTIQYQGASGYGTIKEINYEDSEGYKTLNNEDYSDFLDTLTITSNKTNKLSNGDSITLTVLYDETKAEELKIEFVETSKKYTVKGLKEYPTIDVWNSILVNWEENSDGTDYELKLNVTDNNEVLNAVTFTPTYNADKGTVKVTMDYSDIKDIEKYGFIPKDEKFSHTYKDMTKPEIKVVETPTPTPEVETVTTGPTIEGAIEAAGYYYSGKNRQIYLYGSLNGYTDETTAYNDLQTALKQYQDAGYNVAMCSLYYSEENGYTPDGGYWYGDPWITDVLFVSDKE